MSDATAGLLHTGEMGAAVGQCLAGAGHQVLWVPEGRSPATGARAAAAKGWRWIAEMEEIADTMAAAGLPEGFHQAAAEIYRRFPPADRAGQEAGLDALVRKSPDRSD